MQKEIFFYKAKGEIFHNFLFFYRLVNYFDHVYKKKKNKRPFYFINKAWPYH